MVLVSGIMWLKTSSYQISGVDIAASFLIILLKLYLKCIVTVLPAKSDSDVMFCLQSYQGLIIDRSLVY